VLSVSGGLLVLLRPGSRRRRAVDWRILGGGIALAAGVTLLGLSALAAASLEAGPK
jgi:hypothetical protein